MSIDWEPCEVCAAKPGSPTLCGPCIRNREAFSALKSALWGLQQALAEEMKTCGLRIGHRIVESWTRAVLVAGRP